MVVGYVERSSTVRAAHLPDRSVGFQEVGLQEGVKEVAGQALDGVVDGQHMDALAILHVRTLHRSSYSVNFRWKKA